MKNSFRQIYIQSFPKIGLILGICIGVAIALVNTHTIEYTGDLSNIIQRSYLISQGASPLRWPDPPLRYLPIAGIMKVLLPLGYSSKTVVTGYMIMIEFILIPFFLFRATQQWWNGHAGGWSAFLYGLFSFYIFPPLFPEATLIFVNTMFSDVLWMYAFAVPPILFAWEQYSKENYLICGVSLGIVALIELPMAAMAATVVALTGFYNGNYRSVVEAGITSVVVALPLLPFAYYHLDYWLTTGARRSHYSGYNFLFEGGIQEIAGFEITVLEAKLIGLVVFTLLLMSTLYLMRVSPFVQEMSLRTPPILKIQVVVLLTLELIFGVLLLAIWYHVLITYLLRFTIFSLVGIIMDAVIVNSTDIFNDDALG